MVQYHGEPWLDHGITTMVKPWYHGLFCRETPILVNLDKSPEIDKWLSKMGSRINYHLSTTLTSLPDHLMMYLFTYLLTYLCSDL